jgi:hypothetical protein
MKKILYNEQDFMWHKRELDLAMKYEHDHYHEPKQYPCIVESHFFDDPNGPYTYTHYFIYQEKTSCQHCGHEELVFKKDGVIYEVEDEDED